MRPIARRHLTRPPIPIVPVPVPVPVPDVGKVHSTHHGRFQATDWMPFLYRFGCVGCGHIGYGYGYGDGYEGEAPEIRKDWCYAA
jgi:hypothetical protein